MARKRTYPEMLLEARRQLSERGREVTPGRLLEWAWEHAQVLNHTASFMSPETVWTAPRVIAYALDDHECFEAMLRETAD